VNIKLLWDVAKKIYPYLSSWLSTKKGEVPEPCSRFDQVEVAIEEGDAKVCYPNRIWYSRIGYLIDNKRFVKQQDNPGYCIHLNEGDLVYVFWDDREHVLSFLHGDILVYPKLKTETESLRLITICNETLVLTPR
jgi:hypothetical protein